MTLIALKRKYDTRRRIERIMWLARAEVIRAQLVAMRQSAP